MKKTLLPGLVVAILWYLSLPGIAGVNVAADNLTAGGRTGALPARAPWVDVRDFGGTVDGSIKAAIDSLPPGGGVVLLPPGRYVVNAVSINPGAKPLILQGSGWKTLVGARFGDSQWRAENAVVGTVIDVTGSVDGITTNDPVYRNLIVRDLAILGRGTGSSVGINMGLGAQSHNISLENVLVANFSTGIRVSDSIDDFMVNVNVKGCSTGIRFENTVDEIIINRIDVQACTVAVDIRGGSGVHVYGGLIQGNSTGLRLAPAVYGVSKWTFSGIWFEENGVSVAFDSTKAEITSVVFRDCRESTVNTYATTMGKTISRISFYDCEFSGVTINLVSGMRDVKFVGGIFGSIRFNGAYNVTTLGTISNDTGGYAANAISQQRFHDDKVSGEYRPNMLKGEYQEYLLTGDVTIHPPDNASAGQNMTYILRQNEVGGHSVSWAGGYHVSGWKDSGNRAYTYTTISFRNVGPGQWIQLWSQVPYFP